MKKKHRELLSELSGICNELGGVLDYTATHESKLRDRQRAHMHVYHVLYGILTDHPDNDNAEDDMKQSLEHLEKLKALTKRLYPDRKGYDNFPNTSRD